MKSLLIVVILSALTSGIAHARPVSKKYCTGHQRSFNREIDYKVSKGSLTNARGNVMKLVAYNKCLEAIETKKSVSDFKKIFKRVKPELCESLQVDLSLALESLELMEEVEGICQSYQEEKRSVLEFRLELANKFAIEY